MGPQTITYPATLKPSLLSHGSHELEITILAADGRTLLSSGPATFNINHAQGVSNLEIFAKHILPDGREQDVPEQMPVELRKGLTLLQTQFTNPVIGEEGRSTAAPFLINEGTEYLAHARDYGNYVFDQWSDGGTDRARTVIIEDQGVEPGNASLTAYYRQRAEPPIGLSINAVTLDNRTQLLGMFHKISVGDSRDNLFESGFAVTNLHTLEQGTNYTVFASDCNEYIFDHWENADNPGVPLEHSVNLRGTAINATDNINLVAVYRAISQARPAPISSEANQDTSLQLQGLPGTGEVRLSLRQAFGTGIINAAPLAVPDQSGMHWGPLIFSEGTSGRFTGDNGNLFLAAGTLLELDVSMVAYPGSLNLTLPYDPSVLQTAGNAESMDNIRVFLYDGLAWRDVIVEGSLDASGNTIQGQVPTELASTPVVVATPLEAGTVTNSAPVATTPSQPELPPPIEQPQRFTEEQLPDASEEIIVEEEQEEETECHPSYPDFCIPPPPPNLNCDDISGRRFTVLSPDPHGLDGNNDGVGCES